MKKQTSYERDIRRLLTIANVPSDKHAAIVDSAVIILRNSDEFALEVAARQAAVNRRSIKAESTQQSTPEQT